MAKFIVTICQESGEIELGGSSKIEKKIEDLFESFEEDYEIEKDGFNAMVAHLFPLKMEEYDYTVKTIEDDDEDEFLEITYEGEKSDIIDALEEVLEEIEESYDDSEDDEDDE